MKEEFKNQLHLFMSDNSYKEDYQNIDLPGDGILIEIFKYRTKDGRFSDGNGESTPTLYLIDPLGGGVTTNKDFSVDYTHVAKVLKCGAASQNHIYKEGDCVLLNPFETTKEAFNPDFLHAQEYKNSMGIELITPNDMRQSVPSIQSRFVEFQFVLPHEYNKQVQDIVTFIVPPFKIKAKYNI